MTSCATLLSCLLAFTPSATPGEPTAPPVLVEFFELQNDDRWPTAADQPTEKYRVRTMAQPILPRRYSREGLIVDRQSRFIVRLSMEPQLPQGKYELLVRAMNQARLLIDGSCVTTTEFKLKYRDGHNVVPELSQLSPDIRTLAPGHGEELQTIESSGEKIRLAVEVIVGGKNLRPETGELSLSIRTAGSQAPFMLMGEQAIPLTDVGWEQFVAAERSRVLVENTSRRRAADHTRGYWSDRHERGRQFLAEQGEWDSHLDIDRLVQDTLGSEVPELVDDYAFLRRLSLDAVGAVPTIEEVRNYLSDSPQVRRRNAISRLLSDDRWADHWVSYWQDVLAENPGILKPKLNNTGPFRWWIYESFLDNKPIDRFVTELIMMRGSKYAGGPAGFAMATENDVPMAAKAHVIGQAFLGVQMKCARCHDSPQHDLRQEELFSLAAMLNRGPQKVPTTSSIPTEGVDLSSLAVQVTLQPGSSVAPVWPFQNIAAAEVPPALLRDPQDSREKLAAIVTSYTNLRFAEVIVNRLWHRYLGRGIVDSVDDWEHATCHSPELLRHLAHELIGSGYDLKHVSRLIFQSRTYQAIASGKDDGSPLLPVRRRMTAEQIVDSLFTLSGKQLESEALNLDVDGQRTINTFLNLGVPQRAWEFTSLSNERDRPALAMPRAQSIVDLLLTFGWRDSRQDPLTARDAEPTVQQPGILSNGVVAQRAACLSEDNRLTTLCRTAGTGEELVEDLFLQVLTRPPTSTERQRFAGLLEEGFADRVTGEKPRPRTSKRHAVSWSNHLNEEATRIKIELERQVRMGDPPTVTLESDWRERAEDVVWALVNSPEFVFSP